METMLKHPCFDIEAKKKYGRVHLPVAPKCNVQCNYCNRKYDCVNESRPGVCSAVLSPLQSLDYMRKILSKGVPISVIGIAGPGDPFSNTDEVFDTIRLLKNEFPEKLFCISTNGLELPEHINTISSLGISHVTLTINAIEPGILAGMYAWIRFKKKIYRGIEAGRLMHEQQMLALRLLKERDITVKVNTIIVPGYNDQQAENVAKHVAAMGADVMNCIPLIPNKETAFENVAEPSNQMMFGIRRSIAQYIKPMAHCSRCRADAAGMLGHDIEGSIKLLQECAAKPINASEGRLFTAVASHEGVLVNQHLGEATKFLIYKTKGDGYELIAEREAPAAGSGDLRWIRLTKILNDCQAILVSGAGPNPSLILKNMGLKIIVMSGLIEAGLDAVYKGASIAGYQRMGSFKCGESCAGDGQGCG
jgi:nitrogen fixation protein NifB